MPSAPAVPYAARDAILAWYAANGRRLAFRGTKDPYAILVSEVMSQQTQAARAAEHWQRFMASFPTVQSLAAGTPVEVLRAWQGLGYNRRALALWRAARMIVDDLDGCLPDSIDALQRLPGVGPYTARAVAAIAFGRRVGPLDVNVRRVLSRLVGLSDRLPAGDLQAVADHVAGSTDPATWTHAVMDLGATICRSRVPRCAVCPARPWCSYSQCAAPNAAGGAKRPKRRTERFPGTIRWLRGRLVALALAVPNGTWVELPSILGDHDVDAIDTAARDLQRDGLLELRDRSARVRE